MTLLIFLAAATPPAALATQAARPQASVLSVPCGAGLLLPAAVHERGLASGRGAEARGRWKRPVVLPILRGVTQRQQEVQPCPG